MSYVTKNCKQCDKDFPVEFRRRNLVRFCSISCGSKYSSIFRYRDSKTVLNCTHCSEEFSVNKYAATIGKRKFCSRACADKAKMIAVPHFDCVQCGKNVARSKGKTNQNYNYSQRYCSKACANESLRKPDVCIDKNGYRYSIIDRKQVFQHRAVMEKIIGRKLLSRETVHHRNGVRTDNSPENLELWSNKHGKGQRVSDKISWALELLTQYPSVVSEQGYVLIRREKDSNVLTMSDAICGIAALVA